MHVCFGTCVWRLNLLPPPGPTPFPKKLSMPLLQGP
jgi:hypothetical protein